MKFKALLNIPDETVCLSLEECGDRRELFNKRWKDFIKKQSFRFHISERPTIDSLNRRFTNFNSAKINRQLSKTELGRWGCWLSHYDILCNSLAKDVDSILILEDDAYLNTNIINKEINEVPYDWDVIYLGCGDYDTLAAYENSHFQTEKTFMDSSHKHCFAGWKKVRAWGTYGMIVKNTIFKKYLKELKDYVTGEMGMGPTADGTYYFYIWKTSSFYFNDHLVLHDYSQKSNIS